MTPAIQLNSNAHLPPSAPIPPGIFLSFFVFLSANARDKVKTLFLWLMIEEKSCPSYYKARKVTKLKVAR